MRTVGFPHENPGSSGEGSPLFIEGETSATTTIAPCCVFKGRWRNEASRAMSA